MFDQVTVNVSMDIKDTFEGIMYVRKPSFITLDVHVPERQKVVMRGRSYSVQFLEDQTSVTGEVPAELNVENFFSFFTNIGAIDQHFSFRYQQRSRDFEDNLIFLELLSAKAGPASYRITLGIDSKKFTINREIIYDALGNYNRFDLSEIKFLPSIPDGIFEIATPK
jgi:outer membrane lipoprotein-sorting protein